MIDSSSPAPDEIEVSVFGRGFGEAICVHLGDGEWMVVDSCINPTTDIAAALSYFQFLNIPVEKSVRLVLATHWHDDHVKGLAAVVDACPNATVACSAVVNNKDFLAFVLRQEAARGALGSGVDEFRQILRTCHARRRSPVWAKANLPLHPRPPGDVARVIALSPSDDAFERALQYLIESATGLESAIVRQYRAPEGPNGASVAAWIRNQDLCVLLGADLETSTNPETGWDAVLTYARPSPKGAAVKVPHHGSAGAHHDGMWMELLESDSIAIVTPWIRGKNHLPTQADLERLAATSSEIYITGLPARLLAKRKLDSVVRKVHDADVFEVRGWGHVRARRRVGSPGWRVELDGDAVRLPA